MKDYYAMMGISHNWTQAAITARYRVLAKRWHPDNQESGNAARFRDLQDAYSILGDPAKRALYDPLYIYDPLYDKGGVFGQKVREFVPPVAPGGPVDLMALLRNLAAGRVPDQFVEQLSPVVERKLDEHGINARAATAESILEACGFLKRKKGRKRA